MPQYTIEELEEIVDDMPEEVFFHAFEDPLPAYSMHMNDDLYERVFSLLEVSKRDPEHPIWEMMMRRHCRIRYTRMDFAVLSNSIAYREANPKVCYFRLARMWNMSQLVCFKQKSDYLFDNLIGLDVDDIEALKDELHVLASWDALTETEKFNTVNEHQGHYQFIMKTLASDTLRDRWGATALMYAASYEYMEIITALVAAGANIDIEDHLGSTALISAASSGKFKAVELLLALGADVNKEDKQKKTARIWAVEEGHAEVIALIDKHIETLEAIAASKSTAFFTDPAGRGGSSPSSSSWQFASNNNNNAHFNSNRNNQS